MEFFYLLNCNKFDAHKLRQNFPDYVVRNLTRVHEDEFDSALLKNDLIVLYGSEDLRGTSP
jgi:hypothetical protein